MLLHYCRLFRAENRWVGMVFVLLATLFLQQSGSVTHAQWSYKEIKRPLDPKIEKLASDFNRGVSKDAAGVEAIKQSCVAYVARLTAPYDKGLPKFETVRRQLDQLLAEGEPRQPKEARQALVSTLVQAAGSVAASNEYSPAARVNCALILGDLDDERDVGQNTRKPSASARDRLLQMHMSDTTPVYLKAVVLQGLERHARESGNSWDEATKRRVAQAALVSINQKPSIDEDRQASAWLTRRSLDLLRSMRSKEGIEAALGYLGDPNELPSVRMTSLQYLMTQDVKSLSADQKKQYVHGLAHLLRSELTRWYYAENDRQKRASGGSLGEDSGGMGGLGGGMGGMGGFGGGDPGGFADGGADTGGFGGFGGGRGGGGRGGGAGGRGSGRKPIESQTWEARLARRQLNQLTQNVRLALEGKRIKSENVRLTSFLTSTDVGLAQEFDLVRMVDRVDSLQSIINNADRITNVQSLMNQTRREIEATMRYTKGIPGFLDRYPELRSGEEELQPAPGSEGDDSSDPNGNGGANAGGANAGNDAGNGGQPGGNQGNGGRG